MADPFDTTDDPPRPSILRFRASGRVVPYRRRNPHRFRNRFPRPRCRPRPARRSRTRSRPPGRGVHPPASLLGHPSSTIVRSFVRSMRSMRRVQRCRSPFPPGVRARRAERRGASSCADGGRVRSRAMMFLKISTHPRSLALSLEVAVEVEVGLDGRREGRSVRESVWIL